MKLYFYQTKIARIGIAENSRKITNVYFQSDAIPENVEITETALIREAFFELQAYLAGELKEFSLPLEPDGTVFRQSVWDALKQIPYGKTASYKDIAISIGNPLACRAVGLANNKNPIPIFIPCHRIIGVNGKLTGYRGGVEIKETLLELEKQHGSL